MSVGLQSNLLQWVGPCLPKLRHISGIIWVYSSSFQVKIPRDPKELSFWVATNLPLDDTHRLKILEINCAIQRLRFELSLIEKVTFLNFWKVNTASNFFSAAPAQERFKVSFWNPSRVFLKFYSNLFQCSLESPSDAGRFAGQSRQLKWSRFERRFLGPGIQIPQALFFVFFPSKISTVASSTKVLNGVLIFCHWPQN